MCANASLFIGHDSSHNAMMQSCASLVYTCKPISRFTWHWMPGLMSTTAGPACSSMCIVVASLPWCSTAGCNSQLITLHCRRGSEKCVQPYRGSCCQTSLQCHLLGQEHAECGVAKHSQQVTHFAPFSYTDCSSTVRFQLCIRTEHSALSLHAVAQPARPAANNP